jgi:hypothetical protein
MVEEEFEPIKTTVTRKKIIFNIGMERKPTSCEITLGINREMKIFDELSYE